jgi:hypothetical protein
MIDAISIHAPQHAVHTRAIAPSVAHASAATFAPSIAPHTVVDRLSFSSHPLTAHLRVEAAAARIEQTLVAARVPSTPEPRALGLTLDRRC